MFLLPKALQKEKRLSTTTNTPVLRDDPQHSTNLDSDHLQDENPATFPLQVQVDNPGTTVIEESHVVGALMSDQSTMANGALLSPFNSELQPLTEPQVPKHTTDPSPFSAHAPKPPADNLNAPVRVGGNLTVVLDGQKITGRVLEICPANNPAAPPEWKAKDVTNHVLALRSTHFNKGWHSDNHMPPVHDWVELQRRELKVDLQPVPDRSRTPDGLPKSQTLALAADDNAASDENTPIAPIDQRQESGAQADVHHSTSIRLNPDYLHGPPLTSEPMRRNTQLSGPLTVATWRKLKIDPNKTYQGGGVLGKGSFGKVYLVLRTTDKRQFAMKIHDLRHRMRIRNAEALLKELSIQKSVAGMAFLSGLVDIWYSSAKFLHVTAASPCSLICYAYPIYL